MRIGITGVGVVSPIATGASRFFDAIDVGVSAVGPDAAAARLGCPLVARVGEFGAKEKIAAASLRRMPRLSQMALVAAKEALDEARPPHAPGRIGILIGTGLGTLDETIAFMRGYLEHGPETASPMLFPTSVMNAAAGQLALELKLTGVNSTVNHRDLSALAAIGMACDQLALGRADALLVGAVDEINGPMLEGCGLLGGVTRQAMRPYDRHRDGIAPGEAASFIVLERLSDARARGARIRAVLDGRSETGEARPRVGWGHEASWPQAARAVREAAPDPSRIGWVAGGGNGSGLDERELDAIALGLGGRLPPTSSILAQTGESFSSAMLRVVAALFALERQRLPGTVGLAAPAVAQARFGDALVRTPRDAAVEAVLIPAFAQGGGNAALVLAREGPG